MILNPWCLRILAAPYQDIRRKKTNQNEREKMKMRKKEQQIPVPEGLLRPFWDTSCQAQEDRNHSSSRTRRTTFALYSDYPNVDLFPG